jgi:hypothetical protein
MPDLEPREWRGVILQDGQGLTLASSAATLLPQLIVQRVLSNAPDSASLLAGKWKAVRERALALHRVLGGSDDAMDAIAAVATDPMAREAFRYTKGAETAFEDAHSKLCRAIDRSDAFKHYADWLDARIAQQPRPLEPLDRYGPWSRRTICWEQRLVTVTGGPSAVSCEVLASIIESDAGVDSAVPTAASWSVHAGEASGETALVEAAEALEPHMSSLDTVAAGLATALLTEDTSYRGLAHAEAVVALDEGGDSIRAWQALQSAAWWMARNGGGVPAAIHEGARSMAERHGWQEILIVLDRANPEAQHER